MSCLWEFASGSLVEDLQNQNSFSKTIVILQYEKHQEHLSSLKEKEIASIVLCSKQPAELFCENIVPICDFDKNSSSLYNALLAFITKEENTQKDDYEHEFCLLNKHYKAQILVAEDNEVNQMLIKEILSLYGIEPHIVSNGEEAVQIAKLRKFDLVLMDINMPILDGMSAMKQMKTEQSFHTPIIALTANALEGDKERFLYEGFDGYLSKPIITDALEEVLDNYLEKVDATIANAKASNLEQGSLVKGIVDFELMRKELPFPTQILSKLVSTFLDSSSKHILSLEEAYQSNDLEGMRSAAHTLKGAAANLRIHALAEIALTIEVAIRKEEAIDFEQEIEALHQMYEKVCEELKAEYL